MEDKKIESVRGCSQRCTADRFNRVGGASSIALLGVALAGLSGVCAGATEQTYKATLFLPPSGAEQIYGTALSATGQITGYIEFASGATETFVTTGSTLTNLGTLGGSMSEGNAINASGEVTGVSTNSAEQLAFISNGTTISSIGTLGGSLGSLGSAINGSGQVTGYASNGNGQQDAFLYTSGSMTDLGSLGNSGNSNGLAINASGQVAGDSFDGSGNHHGFITNGVTMTDLGTLGGATTQVAAMNDSGQVTGYSLNKKGQSHAFLYQSGVMTDLKTFGGTSSVGTAINASGQVVGESTNKAGEELAFITVGNKLTRLGTLGGPGSSADAVNASGQVSGTSFTKENASHTFVHAWGKNIDLNRFLNKTQKTLYTVDGLSAINDAGQLMANGYINATGFGVVFLFTPVNPWVGTWNGSITSTCGFITGTFDVVITATSANQLRLTDNYSDAYNLTIDSTNLDVATSTLNGGITYTINGTSMTVSEPSACQTGSLTKQ